MKWLTVDELVVEECRGGVFSLLQAMSLSNIEGPNSGIVISLE